MICGPACESVYLDIHILQGTIKEVRKPEASVWSLQTQGCCALDSRLVASSSASETLNYKQKMGVSQN